MKFTIATFFLTISLVSSNSTYRPERISFSSISNYINFTSSGASVALPRLFQTLVWWLSRTSPVILITDPIPSPISTVAMLILMQIALIPSSIGPFSAPWQHSLYLVRVVLRSYHMGKALQVHAKISPWQVIRYGQSLHR